MICLFYRLCPVQEISCLGNVLFRIGLSRIDLMCPFQDLSNLGRNIFIYVQSRISPNLGNLVLDMSSVYSRMCPFQDWSVKDQFNLKYVFLGFVQVPFQVNPSDETITLNPASNTFQLFVRLCFFYDFVTYNLRDRSRESIEAHSERLPLIRCEQYGVSRACGYALTVPADTC